MTIPWLGLSARVAHFLGVTLPAETDFEVGVEAWGRGDYDRALQEFRLLAEQGEAEAQLALGLQVPATVSLNVSDDGLAAIADIDVLNRDALLSVLPNLV